MSPHQALWQFSSSVESRRAELLLSYRDFHSVSALLDGVMIIGFEWEQFRDKRLKGCHRASFLLCVARETYDAFFNSPVGYRAQYARNPNTGERANRDLLSRLEARLIHHAMNSNPALKSLVIASLRAVQAKLWIYEHEVELQLGAQDPAVMYEPWISNSEDGAGLLAPIGERLEVKGGWLDAAGIECLDPAKITRSSEIHQVGFS